jgi:hypothetical protein
VPTPLAVLYDKKGNQGIYIAPEAFTVATAEFGADAVQFWQDALPGDLKGKLSSLSGAQVLAINGKDPWDAVNANTLISGSYQALPTRQNLCASFHSTLDVTVCRSQVYLWGHQLLHYVRHL